MCTYIYIIVVGRQLEYSEIKYAARIPDFLEPQGLTFLQLEYCPHARGWNDCTSEKTQLFFPVAIFVSHASQKLGWHAFLNILCAMLNYSICMGIFYPHRFSPGRPFFGDGEVKG